MNITIKTQDGSYLFTGAGMRIKIASYDVKQVIVCPTTDMKYPDDNLQSHSFVIYNGKIGDPAALLADLEAAIIAGNLLFDIESWTPP